LREKDVEREITPVRRDADGKVFSMTRGKKRHETFDKILGK